MKNREKNNDSVQYHLWTVSSLVWGVLTLAACAVPAPPSELVEARLALQDAKSAHADKRATRSYDTAAANLDIANKSWEKEHDASAILHQARLAEGEARKAQYIAEAQTAEENLRRETDRKTRNAIALRDAEIMMLRKKGQEEELERMTALARAQERALLDAQEKQAAERARAEREITRLREGQEQFAAQAAERAAAENEAARLREEQEKRAALAAEQARAEQAEREVARLREQQEIQTAQAAERAAAEKEAARLREEQEKRAALAAEQARAEQAEREVMKLRAEHDKTRAELTATLSRLTKVREEARGVVITLPGNIYFNVNQADVKPAMQMQVAKIAKTLAAVPDQYLLIEGHTDSDGSSESNLKLSESRARSVQKILLVGGIMAERMEIRGYGESNPIADNSTSAGKAQNRRVEIVLVPTRR
ncbi:MAG: OmpA family protein [Nitrospira sp.]|nr:OmpA family protein [Nitrospira sp.]